MSEHAGSDGGVREEIKSVMVQRGWSQVFLADALGFTEKHVSQMLTGKAGVTLETLGWIAEAAGSHWQLVPNRPAGGPQ